VAVAAILAARLGMMPCQPRYGGMPRNSSGWNIIRIASSLVTYPIRAAISGIDR
jgi:hypothetical protein